MKYDQYGVAYASCDELCDLLYQKPDLDISRVSVLDPEIYNFAVNSLYAELPQLKQYQHDHATLEEFDQQNQESWLMPEQYQQLDIAEHVLSLCTNDAELQRVGTELLLFQERDLFNLLKYLKYLVDTMREHNIVWGVGRGSSVASFVLFLLGVHKINSLYYDLDPSEFLK
jgi:DNA polymerase III alpha subunit